jgi:methylenetetrahydrofolate reductase (NADPH)
VTTWPVGDTVRSRCPKRMSFGPCGGVEADGGCEVDRRPCPFLELDRLPHWRSSERSPRPVDISPIVVDVRPSDDDRELDRSIAPLAEVGATALIGEHLDDTNDRPIGELVAAVRSYGMAVVATVTGRHRRPSEHRATIEAFVAAGATAVHCVTGDHPAARFGVGAMASFSLDGTQLAAVARGAGARVSVAESPASPPVELRPRRLLSKQRAGADLAIVNHTGGVDRVASFARSCRDAGVRLALVAPVPVITDASSALALERFPGVRLPEGLVRRVTTADEPARVGVDAAVDLGRELLELTDIDAINLSGLGSGAGIAQRAEVMAHVAAEIVPTR